jgi:sulfate transport system permease protein
MFVTFPFVSREIIPVLNAQGRDEEEAAALMGAKGFTIFRKITFPHIKWATIYGMILCASRALGEFGAVNALSKTRGQTFTLPLEIDALYLDGSSDSIVAAFSVSSLLVIIAIVVLVLRSIFEGRSKKVKEVIPVEDASGGEYIGEKKEVTADE